MKEWLVTHIDAVIPFALGLVIALKLAFNRESATLDAAKKRQNAKLGAWILVGIGVLRFFTDTATSRGAGGSQVEQAQSASPVTVTTDDGMVSAEFPQAPVRTEAVDEAPGVKVHRVTRACNFRGIDLRLSYNEYPPGGKETPKEELLANMKEYFKQQGFNLVESSELPEAIHELVMDKPEVKVRQVMRIWFGPDGVYRALATTEDGHHEDPRALALLSSFRRIKTGPEE